MLIQNPETLEEEEESQLQNPKAIVEEEELQIQDPKTIVEEEELQIQDPKTIVEEEELQIQDPKTIVEEEELQIQDPKTIVEEEELQNQNPITIVEEEELQIQDPKIIVEEEELQIQNPKAIVEEEELQIQNPKGIVEEKELQIQNLVTIEEVKEEEEEELLFPNPRTIEEEGDLQIENPNSIPEDFQALSPQLIEEEEEEEKSQQPQNQAHDLDQDCDLLNLDNQPHQQHELEEPEGMDLFPPVHENPPTVPNVSRKGTKRKKPLNPRQRAALEKKLLLIKENLRPIPFVPSKTLDVSKHEKLFKRLGLWEFAHLEFDREIRSDLLALLIATYNPSLRSSNVNDCRIMVNRADLARALKLPVKKDKTIISLETLDMDSEVLSEESISFICDFVSNWILLHEDTWMMPNEVLTWTRFIKEGQPHKVDWPGLIWFMVEKELLQAPQLRSCYYASHLQYLMKSQRGDLFGEETRVVVPMEEEENTVDLKMKSLADFQGEDDSDNQLIVLSLGQDKNESNQQEVREEDVMDFEECKEEPGGSVQWLLDGKSNINQHCLQRCNLNEVEGSDSQHSIKEEEEEEEEEQHIFSSKCPNMDRLASTDLLQEMETTNIPYSPPPMHLHHGHYSGEFLQSRVDSQMIPGSSSMFGNACKRELSEDDGGLHSLNDHHNKRMRSDGPWDHKSSDLDSCFEQMSNWMGKARMIYAEKEQTYINAQVNQEILLSELQQRNNIIENLQKTRCEVQKREMQIYKLDHELLVMNNLLEGYRKALKETRRAFAEYRERFPQPEEPLYKDVRGPGGIVLSTVELEKQRLEREEEEKVLHCIVEEKFKDFELGWFSRLEEYLNNVNLMGKRLMELEEDFRTFKEIFAKGKVVEA